MMSASARWLLLLLAAVGSASSASYAADHPLAPAHRRWLEQEVVYIIADQERRDFLALSDDRHRDEFIENFWKIRDPDPATEVNEYHRRHEERIGVANERFHDGKPGWRTERGRIYIMHGPPDDISFVFGGNPLRIDISNPTEILTEGQQDRRRLFRIEFARPEAEIWVYRHIRGARSFSGYFQIIFSRTDSGAVRMLHQAVRRVGQGTRQTRSALLARDAAIKSFLTGQRMGGEYQILYAGRYKYLGIDDFYQSVFHPHWLPSFDLSELQLALRDLERSPGNVLHEALERRRRLREAVASRVFFEEIDLELRLDSMRSESGMTLLPVTVGIDSAHAGDRLELVVDLLRPDGSSAAGISESIPISASPGGSGDYLYQSRLSVRPGSYTLELYARLANREAVAFQQREVEVPDYSGGDLTVSDLLLFDEVVPRVRYHQSRKERAGNRFVGGAGPLYLRDYVLLPAADSRFRRREKLTTFFEVYNPGLKGDGEPALDLECRIWNRDRLVAAIPGRHLDYVTEGRLTEDSIQTVYGLSIPLQTLQPGEYSLELRVHDRVLKHNVSRRTRFSVY